MAYNRQASQLAGLTAGRSHCPVQESDSLVIRANQTCAVSTHRADGNFQPQLVYKDFLYILAIETVGRDHSLKSVRSPGTVNDIDCFGSTGPCDIERCCSMF